MRWIIGTLLLFALRYSLYAQGYVEKASPSKIGKPTWVIRIYTSNETREPETISFYKKPAQRGSLDPAGIAQDDSRHTWQLRPSNIKSTMHLMAKFAEWSAVAKKNGVRNYEKEIGKTEFPEQTFNFLVKRGVSTLSIESKYGSDLEMDEFDAATVLSLIASIPELIAQTGKAKQADPRDALFK